MHCLMMENVGHKEKRTRESVENFEETYDGDEFYEMYGWIGASTKILIYGKLNIPDVKLN